MRTPETLDIKQQILQDVRMRDFEDSTPLLGDPEALRRRFAEDTHLFFRRLLAPETVLKARADVLATLSDAGWLAPGEPADAAKPSGWARREGDNGWYGIYTALMGLQSLNELPFQQPLVDVAEAVLGEQVLVHPRKIGRVTLPEDVKYTTAPHQDFRLVQGSADTLTAWIPYGDCPRDLGGLRILAGSHARGLRDVEPAAGAGGMTIPVDDDDPAWRTIDYEPGDVVMFHSFAVHGAIPNCTNRLRLSADYRYQRISAPVTRESLRPHYWPFVPGWSSLTRGWDSTSSIETPADLTVVEMSDPFDPAMPVPRSALLDYATA